MDEQGRARASACGGAASTSRPPTADPGVFGRSRLVGLALYADGKGRRTAPRVRSRLLCRSWGCRSSTTCSASSAGRSLDLDSSSRGKSLAVFLVGFLLSVTPGKAGELGKAWLVRELGGGQAAGWCPRCSPSARPTCSACSSCWASARSFRGGSGSPPPACRGRGGGRGAHLGARRRMLFRFSRSCPLAAASA